MHPALISSLPLPSTTIIPFYTQPLMKSPGRRLLRTVWIIKGSSFISLQHRQAGLELLVFNEYIWDTWKSPNTPIREPSSDLGLSSQLTCASRPCNGGSILLAACQSHGNRHGLPGTPWQSHRHEDITRLLLLRVINRDVKSPFSLFLQQLSKIQRTPATQVTPESEVGEKHKPCSTQQWEITRV